MSRTWINQVFIVWNYWGGGGNYSSFNHCATGKTSSDWLNWGTFMCHISVHLYVLRFPNVTMTVWVWVNQWMCWMFLFSSSKPVGWVKEKVHFHAWSMSASFFFWNVSLFWKPTFVMNHEKGSSSALPQTPFPSPPLPPPKRNIGMWEDEIVFVFCSEREIWISVTEIL